MTASPSLHRASATAQSQASFPVPVHQRVQRHEEQQPQCSEDEVDARAGAMEPVRIVQGGDSRQQSVENALQALAPDVDLVAVHDAVRPFVEPDVIEKTIREAGESGAAIVGIVPVDTVKQVKRNKIHGTIPRERLVLAQTPQVFRHDLLTRAFAKAREDGFNGTDESSLVERLEQVEVSVVPGSDRNIKITKPSDMDLARLFLSEEAGQKKAS